MRYAVNLAVYLAACLTDGLRRASARRYCRRHGHCMVPMSGVYVCGYCGSSWGTGAQ